MDCDILEIRKEYVEGKISDSDLYLKLAHLAKIGIPEEAKNG